MSGSVGGGTLVLPWSLAATAFVDDVALGGPGDAHVNTPSSTWPFVPGKLDANFSVSRAQASGAKATTIGGNDASLASWAADVPRYDSAGQSLLLEPACTNYVRNPRLQGYVAGTPGTMPTNWIQAMPAGVGITLLGTYKLGDLTVGRFRMFGTPTVVGALLVAYDWAGTAVTGQAEGANYSQGVWCALTGGSLANTTSVNHWASVKDSLSTPMAVPQPGFTPTGSLKYFQTPNTMAGGVAPYFSDACGIVVYPVLNQPIDLTLDIGAPSFVLAPPTGVLGSTVMPAIGTPAVSTRADDSVTATRSSIWPANRGTLLINGMLRTDITGSGLYPVLAAWYTDIDNWFGVYFNSATGRIAVGGLTGGAASFDSGSSLPVFLISYNVRVALSFNASGGAGTHTARMAARVGSTVNTYQATGLTLPTTTLFAFGRYGLTCAAPMSVSRAQTIPQIFGIPALRGLLNA